MITLTSGQTRTTNVKENIIIQLDDNINVIIQPGSILEDRRGCEFGRA
jgi:hypothetical protein